MHDHNPLAPKTFAGAEGVAVVVAVVVVLAVFIAIAVPP
jgi:hypothetical protein